MTEYFTPDIEDIRVGYECECLWCCQEPRPWLPIVITKEDNLNTKSLPFGVEVVWRLQENELRVPYLTKEQIEAEGWSYKGKTQDIWFEKELDYDMGSWTAYKVVMQYGVNDKRLRIFAVDRIDKLDYDCFIGECKDINTFRYICKLLKIK